MRIIPITPLFLLVFAMFIFGWSITQYGGISQYGAGFMPCIISGLLLFLAAINFPYLASSSAISRHLFAIQRVNFETLFGSEFL